MNNSKTNHVSNLKNKIKKEFQNKTYDLIVHFKGFDNLFADGVYNSYGILDSETELNPAIYTEDDKKKHIDEIAEEYIIEIKGQLDKLEYDKLDNKTLLLVWDGDGLEETQWTQVMIATANKLKEQEAMIEFLCCYQKKDGIYGHEPDFTDSLKNLGVVHQFTYEELGVNDFNEVGMVLLYITSNLISRTTRIVSRYIPILVLCAGGGETPVNEYNFTQRNTDFTINRSKLNSKNTHPLASKLINYMEGQYFKWFGSMYVRTRFTKKNEKLYLEKSLIKELLLLQIIVANRNSKKLRRSAGGARKKRTIKKKKSLKKKSKKNKSKRKRKC